MGNTLDHPRPGYITLDLSRPTYIGLEYPTLVQFYGNENLFISIFFKGENEKSEISFTRLGKVRLS